MNRIQVIRAAVRLIPAVLPHLRARARWIALTADATKSAEQFDARLTNLVKALYKNTIGAQSFIDSLAALIARQITLAFREAWSDEGDGGQFPDYLAEALDNFVIGQYDFVDQFARDIVDVAIDEKPIDGLLSRVPLWANRYTEAYNEAVALITKAGGGNLEWFLGATEKHCPLCSRYNGIVARASEWESLGIAPQNAPNPALTGHIDGEDGCEGWRCDCRLKPTKKRRTPGAYGKLEEILASK